MRRSSPRAETSFDLVARLCAETVRHGAAALSSAPAGHEHDWDEFLRLVERHRVAGLIHRRIASDPAFPEAVRRRVAADAAIIVRRNLRLAGETVRLQRRLDAAGLSPIFLKGFTLSQRAYGSGAIKHSKDIDFLVAPSDAQPCVELLEHEGYRLIQPRPVLHARQWGPLLRHHIEIEMAHPETGIQLEPHWRLAENPRLLKLGPLIAAAGFGGDAIGDTPIRTLHPDDQFTYLCVHGVRGAWFRLKWIVDLYALIASAPREEIARLHRHAVARGVGPCADLALLLCADLFGLQLPEAVGPRLAGDWRVRALRRLCLSSLHAHDENATRLFAKSLLVALCHHHLGSELAGWAAGGNDALDFPMPDQLRFLYWGIRLPSWVARRIGLAGRGGSR